MVFSPQSNVPVSESDLRPDALYLEWRSMLEKEVRIFFGNKENLSNANCPGCQSTKTVDVFEVFGLNYKKCSDCESLFVSPRPTQKDIDAFYVNSKATLFWKEKIIKKTLPQRSLHHANPLKKWIKEITKTSLPSADTVLEYKPKFSSLFLHDEFFKKASLFSPLHVFEEQANEPNIVQRLGNTFDVVVACNVLDREAKPKDCLQEIAEVSKPGSLLFMTANTASGFEYLVLREHSQHLVPPDRLNLLTLEAIQTLVEEAGYEILDITTPGKLDVEIIAKAHAQNQRLPMPEFLKYILEKRDQSTMWSLQNFLQLNNLSSFLRVAARKKS